MRASNFYGRVLRWMLPAALSAGKASRGWRLGPFSTHPGSSVQEGDEALRMSLAPYDVPHVRGDLDVVWNKTIVGQYRGVGHPIATAISEYMIDKAAAVMGIEGADLRRRNYLSDAGYP